MNVNDPEQNYADAQSAFRQIVLEYLGATGRLESGRAYFGVLAANYPGLVRRLDEGGDIGLKVVIKVLCFIRDNPPEGHGELSCSKGPVLSDLIAIIEGAAKAEVRAAPPPDRGASARAGG